MKKLVVAAVVLGALLSAGFGVFLGPLLYTLTPLQRHYLVPYLLSSWKADDGGATTNVRWIWKIRPDGETTRQGAKRGTPKYQYELAREDDLIAVPASELFWKGDRLPFRMSRKAELEGWLTVTWLAHVEVKSGELTAILRQEFFGGEQAWRFFVQPVVLVMLLMLLTWILVHEWSSYRERNRWRTVPLWLHLGQRTLEAGRQFQRRLELRRETLALPPAAPVRTIEATVPKPRSVPAPATPKPVPPTETILREASKPPVQAALWDESKGLE